MIFIRTAAIILFLIPTTALAGTEAFDYALGLLAPQYNRLGGPAKALNQLRCFVRSHGFKRFAIKPSGDMAERCEIRPWLALENERGVAIVDYTAPSDRPRFFLFDILRQEVHALHTSHGRYGDTSRSNTKLSYNPKRNSILRGIHFSNQPGLNASAGGFYLTAQEYVGSYGRSLVLHGLERGINDNSCLRATVIHPSSHITESSTHLMSSGCPMISRSRIDQVVETLRDGALFYSFTPNEAQLSDTDCGRGLLD